MNKLVKTGLGIVAGATLIAGSYLAGRNSVDIPYYNLEVYRTDNKAYLVRISEKDNLGNALEITEDYQEEHYIPKLLQWERKNRNFDVTVQDIDR